MSPRNVVVADMLLKIFPEMKMIHSVRDGRDAAVSVSRSLWGPDNPVDGLDWWDLWLRRAGATERRMPNGSVHLAQFEGLVMLERDETLSRLCRYLGIEADDVAEFFDSEMAPERANLARWATDLEPDAAARLNDIYLQIYQDLIYDGIRCRPITPFWQDLYA